MGSGVGIPLQQVSEVGRGWTACWAMWPLAFCVLFKISSHQRTYLWFVTVMATHVFYAALLCGRVSGKKEAGNMKETGNRQPATADEEYRQLYIICVLPFL